MFTCEWCGQVWNQPISAALCCDETANSLHDTRLDPPRYTLGYD